MKRKIDVIDRYNALCRKYIDVLEHEEVWQLDTMLSIVWDLCKDEMCGTTPAIVAERAFPEEVHNGRVAMLLEELRGIYNELEELGITHDDVRRMLWEEQKISRICVERACYVELPDYGVSLHLTPLQWSVYVLFLKHPEGILLKEVCDYREEICGLLRRSNSNENMQRMMRELDRLTDPTTGAMNENISRIRRAFINAMGNNILARHYYINGTRRDRYHIPLDRSFLLNASQGYAVDAQ